MGSDGLPAPARQVRGGYVPPVEGVTFDVYLRAIVPIGALFSIVLWLGNTAYLYLSVSFIQMLKVRLQSAHSHRNLYSAAAWPGRYVQLYLFLTSSLLALRWDEVFVILDSDIWASLTGLQQLWSVEHELSCAATSGSRLHSFYRLHPLYLLCHRF
jgi:hypothetical protein